MRDKELAKEDHLKPYDVRRISTCAIQKHEPSYQWSSNMCHMFEIWQCMLKIYQ